MLTKDRLVSVTICFIKLAWLRLPSVKVVFCSPCTRHDILWACNDHILCPWIQLTRQQCFQTWNHSIVAYAPHKQAGKKIDKINYNVWCDLFDLGNGCHCIFAVLVCFHESVHHLFCIAARHDGWVPKLHIPCTLHKSTSEMHSMDFRGKNANSIQSYALKIPLKRTSSWTRVGAYNSCVRNGGVSQGC